MADPNMAWGTTRLMDVHVLACSITDSQSNLCKHLSAPRSWTDLDEKKKKNPLQKNRQQSFSSQDSIFF